MDKKILDHYLQYSQFTYPGKYENDLKNLPDEIKTLCILLRKQFIHRVTLEKGLVGADATREDIKRIPWYRQAEDDYFITASSIIAELYRRDSRGITEDRKPEDKLILTCRYTTILIAAALKAKKIPCRVRSGYAPYFPFEKGLSWDHWINEYWSDKEQRWIVMDVDGSGHSTGYNMFDLPKDAFDYPATSWINCRTGKDDIKRFMNAAPATGLKIIAWALFYDFHCLMNSEIIYLHGPKEFAYRWDKLNKEDLEELDDLAKLMLDPDKNFEKIKYLWETEKEYRLLKGGLL